VCLQRVLDLAGLDVEPAADHHVLVASDDMEVTLRVEAS
jgi:hypothetical protein